VLVEVLVLVLEEALGWEQEESVLGWEREESVLGLALALAALALETTAHLLPTASLDSQTNAQPQDCEAPQRMNQWNLKIRTLCQTVGMQCHLAIPVCIHQTHQESSARNRHRSCQALL